MVSSEFYIGFDSWEIAHFDKITSSKCNLKKILITLLKLLNVLIF